MERLIYILDTNAIADYINAFEPTASRIDQAIQDGHLMILCEPVIYEVLRGLLKVQAERKRRIFEEQFAPKLTEISVIKADWQQAAKFWADTTRSGKQLVEIDLLIAAVAVRLNAIIVSADADFDALAVRRENWRV